MGKVSISLYGNGGLSLRGSDSGGHLFGWGVWIIIIQWMEDGIITRMAYSWSQIESLQRWWDKWRFIENGMVDLSVIEIGFFYISGGLLLNSISFWSKLWRYFVNFIFCFSPTGESLICSTSICLMANWNFISLKTNQCVFTRIVIAS